MTLTLDDILEKMRFLKPLNPFTEMAKKYGVDLEKDEGYLIVPTVIFEKLPELELFRNTKGLVVSPHIDGKCVYVMNTRLMHQLMQAKCFYPFFDPPTNPK